MTSSLPLWVYLCAVIIGIAATHAGAVMLTRMFTDEGFIAVSWLLSRLASVVFLAQGLWLLWQA